MALWVSQGVGGQKAWEKKGHLHFSQGQAARPAERTDKKRKKKSWLGQHRKKMELHPSGYVFIKLVGAGLFGEVPQFPGDTVGRLVDRACTKFSKSWGVDCTQVGLHLVTGLSGDQEPTEDMINSALADSRLGVARSLDALRVTSGAWLVAKTEAVVPPPPQPLGDPVVLLSAFHAQPLDARQQDALRYHDAFSGDRAQLAMHTFVGRHLGPLLQRLDTMVATTTRQRLATITGIVLDGPISGSNGQAGTSILLALQDGEVRCAKVGPSDSMSHEWEVSQTIHAHRTVPTVARALTYEKLPSSHGLWSDSGGGGGGGSLGMLLLPLYPMSAAAAKLALMPERTALVRTACRDILAVKVALCGLAGISAFASAGWAHGDIKPGNVMLPSTAGGPCVLIDFGSSRPLDQALTEFTPYYGLDIPPMASVAYDLACLATTIAALQYDLPLKVGGGSGEELLVALQALDGKAGEPRPPASFAAQLCLELCGRGREGGGRGGARSDVGWEEVRSVAEQVVSYATTVGIAVPALDQLWHSV